MVFDSDAVVMVTRLSSGAQASCGQMRKLLADDLTEAGRINWLYTVQATKIDIVQIENTSWDAHSFG